MEQEIKIGAQYGQLTILRRVGEPIPKGGRHIRWECKCSCGTRKVIQGRCIRNGQHSCGCLGRDRIRLSHTKHGQYGTAEYKAWSSMKARCNTPSHKNYNNYGGRGITICARWQGLFDAFLADMGPRPSGKHSLDRIDNEGHYEPTNCRWATSRDQGRNRRTNRRVTIDGRRLSLREWADELGISYDSVMSRLARGLSPEAALTVGRIPRSDKGKRRIRSGL